MSGNNLPNLIIAGVTKGGSTSVFSYLADHPDICASARKEICYFMNLRFDRPLADIAEYKDYFSHCGVTRYRMEASPGYIYGGRRLAQGMKDVLECPKIIIVLREPIKRMYSFFKSHQNKFIIEQGIDFHEYLRRCKTLSPEKCKNPDFYPYFQLTNGCYSEYLPAWMDIFGPNLQILFFEDLVCDNRGFMRSICKWLGIDPGYYDNYDFVIENKTRGVKWKNIHRMVMNINDRCEKILRKNMKIKRFFRNLYYAVNEAEGQTSRISMEDMEYLKSYYAPFNDKLARLLRKKGHNELPDWLNV